jgi:hypothetical protein
VRNDGPEPAAIWLGRVCPHDAADVLFSVKYVAVSMNIATGTLTRDG